MGSKEKRRDREKGKAMRNANAFRWGVWLEAPPCSHFLLDQSVISGSN